MDKKLYVWTTEDKLALAPRTKDLVVKIGDAYDVGDRVLGEGIDLSKRVILKTYNIKNRRDYDYHEELGRSVYDVRRLKHHVECETREAFAFPINSKSSPTEWVQKVLQIVDSVVEKVGGTPEVCEFVPTTWQRKAIEFVSDCLTQGKETILLELAARFGKTGMITQLFDYSDADVLVVANYVRTVNSSFGGTVVKYFNDRISYLDTSDPEFESRLQKEVDSGKKVLVTCSLFNSQKIDKKIDSICKIRNRFVVVDEADFGAHTKSNLSKVEKLRKGVPLILMTGTNADRAVSSHKIDAHMASTYFDMLMDT